MQILRRCLSAALCSAFFMEISNAALFPNIDSQSEFTRSISITAETIGDKVSYSPNLVGGGHAYPERRSRHQSTRFEYTHSETPETLLNLSLSQRQLNSVRDSYDINQLTINYAIRVSPTLSRYSVDFSFGALLNHSDSLVKNSFTNYAGNLITRSSIENPQDQTLYANVISGFTVSKRVRTKLLVGGGVTRSDHESINGIGVSNNGCQYAFAADSGGGSLRQIGVCGDVINYQQTFVSEDGVSERLGFRPSEDVAYLARFAQFGAQISWSTSSIAMSIGYRYRHYFRGKIDENITVIGNSPVNVSQTLEAEVSYQPNRRWKLTLGTTYYSAPFLDDVPMLYTAFTSDRYDNTDVLNFRLVGSWYFDGISE